MLNLKTLRTAGITAALVAASASAASAADMLTAPPPPPMVPAASAIAADSGLYLRGDIGYGHNTYDKLFVSPIQAGVTTVTSGDSLRGSIVADVGVGYQWNSWLRSDVTVGYRSGGAMKFRETITPGLFVNDLSGKVSAVVALANAYVDLGTWNKFTPYVGVGIGVRSVSMSGIRDFAPSGPGTGSDGFAETSWHTGLAWALHAGVAYDITSNWKMDLGYRYLNMGDARSNAGLCRQGGTIPYHSCGWNVNARKLASHDIRFGVRYIFADAAPVAYAPGPLVRKY